MIQSTLKTQDATLYEKVYAAYNGTLGFKTGEYLIQFPEESNSKYAFRKQVSMYDNAFKMIIDGNITPIFNNVIRENEDKNDLLTMFLDDCDGAGTPFSSKIRNIGINSDIGGVGVLFFDNISTSEYVGQAKAAKEYPKLIDIKSNQIFSYRLDQSGNLTYLNFYRNENYIRYTYINDKPEEFPNGYFVNFECDKNGKTTDKVSSVQAAIAAPMLYTFGSVSGIELPSTQHISLLSQSETVYGIDSLISYQSYMNTFKPMWASGMTEISTSDVTQGEDSIWLLPEGAQMGVLEVPSAIEELANAKEKIKKNMFENYNLGILNTSADASGESREQADTLRNTELLRKSQIAELLEQVIIGTYGVITNQRLSYKCEYPTTFKPSSMSDTVAVAKEMLALDVSPKNQTRIKQQILGLNFSAKSREELNEIMEDELVYNPSEYDDTGIDEEVEVEEKVDE